jgi:hypothetical protein
MQQRVNWHCRKHFVWVRATVEWKSLPTLLFFFLGTTVRQRTRFLPSFCLGTHSFDQMLILKGQCLECGKGPVVARRRSLWRWFFSGSKNTSQRLDCVWVWSSSVDFGIAVSCRKHYSSLSSDHYKHLPHPQVEVWHHQKYALAFSILRYLAEGRTRLNLKYWNCRYCQEGSQGTQKGILDFK